MHLSMRLSHHSVACWDRPSHLIYFHEKAASCQVHVLVVRQLSGRVGEKATPVARPTLPSSNRRCRFPASGSPESSRLRHAQCPIDGSAPSAPNAEAIVLLADDGMASGCAVANAGSDGPERSVRSHSRYSRDTRRKSSSSILSGADLALRSGLA